MLYKYTRKDNYIVNIGVAKTTHAMQQGIDYPLNIGHTIIVAYY